jgi:hypothetical protein
MSGVATAAIGGAVVSGYLGNKAAGKQAAATRDAARMADPFSGERGMYQGILRDIYGGYGGAGGYTPSVAPTGAGSIFQAAIGGMNGTSPMAAAGGGAPGGDTAETGTGGGGGIAAFIRSNPAYQFQFAEGQRALEHNASAKGMLRSGNLLRDLISFGQGQASTAYESEINRIMQMAGVSAGQPGVAGQLGANAAATRAAGSQNMVGQIGYGISRGIDAYMNRPLQTAPAGTIGSTPSWYGSGGMGTIT